MIAAIIRWSIANRFLVVVLTLLLTAWGIYALRETPVRQRLGLLARRAE